MSRIRVVIGIALVAAGVAWLFGGVEALRTIGRNAPIGVAIVLVAIGVWSMAHTLDPGGRLVGPLLVIGSGLVIFTVAVIDIPAASWRLLGQFGVIAAGGAIALAGVRRSTDVATGVLRCTAALVPRACTPPVPTPAKVELRAFLGPLSLNLTGAEFPLAERLEVEVTTFWGNVDITVPEAWRLVPGNLRHTPLVHMKGQFATAVAAGPEPGVDDRDRQTVVLHVMGWGGSVTVT